MSKKLKDGSYYWVRRKPINHEDGSATYPDWQPMMWWEDEQVFSHQGGPPYKQESLKAVGDEIVRQQPRKSKKGWAPVYRNHRGKYDVDIENMSPLHADARLHSDGKPIRVEVTYDAQELKDRNKVEL